MGAKKADKKARDHRARPVEDGVATSGGERSLEALRERLREEPTSPELTRIRAELEWIAETQAWFEARLAEEEKEED